MVLDLTALTDRWASLTGLAPATFYVAAAIAVMVVALLLRAALRRRGGAAEAAASGITDEIAVAGATRAPRRRPRAVKPIEARIDALGAQAAALEEEAPPKRHFGGREVPKRYNLRRR